MNIVPFNYYAISPSLPGMTRHYDYGRLLVDRGHDVTVVASVFVYNSLLQWLLSERGRLLPETHYSGESEAQRLADGYASFWSARRG